MLEIGNGGMTGDEYRLHMSVWAMLSAPLIAGNDLRTMSDETKSILLNTEVIAVDQDKAVNPVRAVGQPGTPDTAVVWAKTLADGSLAIAMLNRGEAPTPMSVAWNSIGLAGKRIQARDLWAHGAVEASGDSYTAVVPKHGVTMLRVSAK
jgi:alpha-galactosidase